MRRNIFVLSLVLGAALAVSSSPAGAATRIETPEAMVYLPMDACAQPDQALFATLSAEVLGGGWRLVGADARRWALEVDLVRAATLGIPLPMLRERLGLAPAKLPTDDAGIARHLIEGTLALPKGDPVPLQAFVGLQVTRFLDETVFVDKVPVLAAVTTAGSEAAGSEAGGTLVSAVRAAAALARSCGQPLDAVQILAWPPRRVAWRISYRAGTPEADGAWARATTLENTVAAARGGGRTVGVHRPSGGVIWGLREGGREPKAPDAAALRLPDTHVLAMPADGSHWRHPFQAVIRFEDADPSLGAALAAARQLAQKAGAGTRVVFRVGSGTTPFAPDEAKVAAAGLSPEDIAFALFGTGFSLRAGEVVEVRVSTGTSASERRVVGADGEVRPLTALGTFSPQKQVIGLPGSGGEASAIYVCVPADAVRPTAIAMSQLTLPEGVRTTTVNWNVLSQDDGRAILDWWEGAR